MQVREIMTTKVITLRIDSTIRDAVEIFGKNKIGGAPIINENGELVGMITDSDIFKLLRTKYKEFNIVFPTIQGAPIDYKGINRYHEVLKAFAEVANTTVALIMRHEVVSMAPDDLVEEAIPMMVDKRINRIPVILRSKVVGIFSRGDIIRALLLQILKEKVEAGDVNGFGKSRESAVGKDGGSGTGASLSQKTDVGKKQTEKEKGKDSSAMHQKEKDKAKDPSYS